MAHTAGLVIALKNGNLDRYTVQTHLELHNGKKDFFYISGIYIQNTRVFKNDIVILEIFAPIHVTLALIGCVTLHILFKCYLLLGCWFAMKSLITHICSVPVIAVLKQVHGNGIYNVLWQLVPIKLARLGDWKRVRPDLCVHIGRLIIFGCAPYVWWVEFWRNCKCL